MTRYVKAAEKVFELEAAAILQLKNQLTADFDSAIKKIIASSGKVIICGMGKSGLIGQKIAATLASTGTSSFFLHPGEAFHGDLGMISPNDVFIAISNSGETEEVIRLLPFLKDNKNIIIAMSGNIKSTLAKHSNYHLNVSVKEEACPLQLAPTSSTTATLAMGDALAVALMIGRDFQPEHFARFHPGGSLGRRLLTTVKDIMLHENLPFVDINSKMSEIIKVISAHRLGMVMVGSTVKLNGVITDGDLRRVLENHGEQFHLLTATEIMTESPTSIAPTEKVQLAIDIMNTKNISVLPVVEQNKVVGVLHLFDCNI